MNILKKSSSNYSEIYNNDNKYKFKSVTVDRFPHTGYTNFKYYIENLIEYHSYEFEVEIANAYHMEIPTIYNTHELRYVENKVNLPREYLKDEFTPLLSELGEGETELSSDESEPDVYTFETYRVRCNEDASYNFADVIVLSEESNNTSTMNRYIGYIKHINRYRANNTYIYEYVFNIWLKSKLDLNTKYHVWVINNMTTFERVNSGLYMLLDSHHNLNDNIQTLLYKEGPKNMPIDIKVTEELTSTTNPESKLNVYQQAAIDYTLNNNTGIYLIQGPPGCGKTLTVIEMIQMFIKLNETTLVCTQNNITVCDLFYKYIQTTNIEAEHQYILDIKPEKIPIKYYDILYPYTVVSYYNKVVYGILDHICSILNIKPTNHIDFTIYRKWCKANNILTTYRVPDIQKKMLRFLKKYYNEFYPYITIDNTELQDKLNDTHVKSESLYKAVKYNMMFDAKMVSCTISTGTTLNIHQNIPTLANIVIDEAAQALEPAIVALLNVTTQLKRLVLVGDPMQLRAYSVSHKNKYYKYDRSLMERLQEYKTCDVLLLGIQYRMHPKINEFISKAFYNNRLINSPTVMTRAKPFTIPEVTHLVFTDSVITSSGTSFVNTDEANSIIAHIIKYLTTTRVSNISSDSIVKSGKSYTAAVSTASTVTQNKPNIITQYIPTVGIICMYKMQSLYISNIVNKLNLNLNIRVSTIDAFQGQECDVVYIALTRNNKISSFINESHRVNVAVSRACHHIIIAGDYNLQLDGGNDLNYHSYWHTLCNGANYCIMDKSYIQRVPRYDGLPLTLVGNNNKIIDTKQLTLQIKNIFQSTCTTHKIWTTIINTIIVDSNLKYAVGTLKYVINSIVNGLFHKNTNRVFYKPHSDCSNNKCLHFVTTVNPNCYISWTIDILNGMQVIKFLGIGTLKYIEGIVWKTYNRSLIHVSEWLMNECMNL